MKSQLTLISAICIMIAGHSPLHAQQDGGYLFKTYCANCHEGSSADSRAPQTDVMKQMTPEHILEVLEKGVMKAQAAERSRAQRRTLAEYLTGKSFGSAPPDLMQRSAFCSNGIGPFKNTLDGPTWNGWGVTVTNTRFQPAASAQLTAENVPRLKLKWAFGYPGATSGGTQPVVAGGRVYVGTAEGDLYSLDASTGCVHWIFEADAGIRSAISLGKVGNDKLAAFFGDQSANMYAVDAQSGKVLWKRKIDENSRAAITAAPGLNGGRLYVGVSSREESQVGDPRYPCCEFRGSMVALDASDGMILWKTYTIADEAHQLGKNGAGTTMWGPSGVPIWNSPTIDVKRNVLYAGTGNNYSTPATEASDSIIAFDMASGKIRWISQVAENDVWNGSCRRPDRSDLVCPDADAPDADVSSSPILVDINGHQMILSGNKSGMLYALDPDQQGKVIWKQSTGKGSTSGGIMWGSAVDAEKVYSPNAYFNAMEPESTGGVTAFQVATGQKVWTAPAPPCAGRKSCKPSHAAAVTAIPGVLFSGTWDGRFRAYSTADGRNIWEYDTAHDYQTVNGVKANGGSMSNAGATVVGGMVFTNSGYSHHGGIIPGNVLLAFSVD
jgi:polyvinyl alcohol dehydrogenase (cytochrome)